MYEKCITCPKIGESCVPNLMRLAFPELLQWCNKRQKHLGWTSQRLADESKVPVGTINRIKAGDYLDCKYSTIRNIVIALVGGTADEFSCGEQVEKQLENLAMLTNALTAAEKENAELKLQLSQMEEKHRSDIRAVRDEYREEIAFLKDDIKAWRERGHN